MIMRMLKLYILKALDTNKKLAEFNPLQFESNLGLNFLNLGALYSFLGLNDKAERSILASIENKKAAI